MRFVQRKDGKTLNIETAIEFADGDGEMFIVFPGNKQYSIDKLSIDDIVYSDKHFEREFKEIN